MNPKPRFTELRFRYSSTDRARGTWHVAVGGRWGKAGNYAVINAKTMRATLPAILARRAVDAGAISTASHWHSVGQLLAWYQERMIRDCAQSFPCFCRCRRLSQSLCDRGHQVDKHVIDGGYHGTGDRVGLRRGFI